MTKKTNKTLSVSGAELKGIFDKIVLDNDLFEIDADYFWEIDSDEIYDCPENEPKSINLGQVSEEWEMLNSHLEDEDFYPSNIDLVKFGRIIKAIGDNTDIVSLNENREKQDN